MNTVTLENAIRPCPTLDPPVNVPPITMKRRVLCQIMCSVGAYGPEAGGILIGPIGTDRITDFYFDTGASCTVVTYTPDIETLRRKLRDEWIPSGLDFKGFVHSHPGEFDRLSEGDLDYIGRLLARNADLQAFPAPIVIPRQFRLRPIVVLRNQPRVQHPTRFQLME